MKAFNCSYGPVYGRLAQVLAASIGRHSPGVEVVHRKMMPAAPVAGVPDHATINTGKLWTWWEFVQHADDDVMCTDADMVCLGDLTAAFSNDRPETGDGRPEARTSSLQPPASSLPFFDVAYTVRPGLKRYQGGVVFVRNTEAARRFMEAWAVMNDSLLDDPDRLEELIHAEGGCNQAALSIVAPDPPEGVVLAELPCAVWNCCYQTWGSFGPDTRLLHLTGRLRRAVLEGRRADPEGPYADLAPMLDAWLVESRP